MTTDIAFLRTHNSLKIKLHHSTKECSEVMLMFSKV